MWLVVLQSCWVKAYKLMTRYLFNMLSGFVTLYMVFALLFFGAKSIGGSAIDLGDTLEGIFAGYLTWMLAMMGSTELAWNVTNEAQTGTFEQQYLSPVGYRWIAVFTESFNFVYNVSLIFLIALVMAATTGQEIHLHLGSTLPVMLSVYIQATGLGFALAGLALMYKRVQSFFQVVQFLMVGFFLIPWDRFPWARYLPLAASQRVLQRIIMNGDRIWQLPAADLILVLCVTVTYVALGAALFALAESKAKERGVLGQY
ncbi:MAG: hypothetical protein ACOX5Q_10510 [Bacillota bacterium]|jgi:ABC-2 type transport system permease protein|nr:ABC transporter permease [Candidatus Fermentithermobacillaceae bacterium]